MPAFTIKAERDQLVTDRLTEHLGAGGFTHERLYDTLCFTVPKAKVHDVLAFLRDELDFKFLTSLCGMHFPGLELELGAVYFLHSMRNGHRIRVKTYTSMHEAKLPTVTDLWPTANWMERETWDFFGIHFTGHPNLKRILNMEDFPAFPMRKDYPLEDPTREDKDNTFFGR
ncbi:MAG: NADH-quinone oxidoreductase subunit C [Flavobacteriales bacterium]|nr:NADH-quinone oxidoreductase subunit C [Flavobacteriales bacterium]MBP9078731.1 NADH-quinone oxidoreductase subunit C [Flavobacteriales bacterium]